MITRAAKEIAPLIRLLVVLVALFVGASAVAGGQRPPGTGEGVSPDPGPNRIEVRFAIGEKSLTCDRFHLVAWFEGKKLIDGDFHQGFQIPNGARSLPHEDGAVIDVKCAGDHWHFRDVPGRAFLKGWWWIGTDYPPFQEMLSRDPQFEHAAWIKYLIVAPTEESGFYVFHMCPANLQNQKPGPCYTD